jgi:hypothetical protein
MWGEFFENTEIIDIKKIEPDLFGCSLLDHVENGF